MTVYEFPIDPNDSGSAYTWQIRFSAGACSLLEIGCSTGFLSRHLVAAGTRVVGVEMNRASAEQARAVCARVIVGDIEAPEVQAMVRERFDIVLLGDVVEHLKEPMAFLVRVRDSWLAPSGHVVLSVPNSAHWIFRREVARGRFPYRTYGLFDSSHLRFFTRDSLHRLVEDAGYVVDASAVTVNSNKQEDLTFASLAWLYRRRGARLQLVRLEGVLARAWPALFAYQFVLRLRPVEVP